MAFVPSEADFDRLDAIRKPDDMTLWPAIDSAEAQQGCEAEGCDEKWATWKMAKKAGDPTTRRCDKCVALLAAVRIGECESCHFVTATSNFGKSEARGDRTERIVENGGAWLCAVCMNSVNVPTWWGSPGIDWAPVQTALYAANVLLHAQGLVHRSRPNPVDEI